MIEILDGSWGAPLLQRGPWHESLRYRYITQLAEPYAPVIDNKLSKIQLNKALVEFPFQLLDSCMTSYQMARL